jgi:hypothetical protein
LARVLPHVLRWAAAGVFALVSASPALAQRYHDRGDPRTQDQRVQQDPRAMDPRAVDPRAMDPRAIDPRALPPPREQRFDPRTFDSREVEDRRRQEQGAHDTHHSSRLTPDERRDLRRQINEAGMDLYSRPPRH